MRSIIMLSIQGDMFLVEDKEYSNTNKEDMQKLADNLIKYNPEWKEKSEEEIYAFYIQEAKEQLGLTLHRVKISHVVRII